MKNLRDYIGDAPGGEIMMTHLDGFKWTDIDTEVFKGIDNAINDWKKDTHKDIKQLTEDDVIDYFDNHDGYQIKYVDDDNKSKWLEITYNENEHAYILLGDKTFALDDIENFKYKNTYDTVLYIISESRPYCICVKNLLKMIKRTSNTSLITPDKKYIKFSESILKLITQKIYY